VKDGRLQREVLQEGLRRHGVRGKNQRREATTAPVPVMASPWAAALFSDAACLG